MTSVEPLVFNPLDPAFRVDPYPIYERLVAEEPVHEGALGVKVFSRHADCEAILRDRRWSSDFRNASQLPFDSSEELFENEARPFLFLDPPDHTRLRGLVNKAFTPRVVEGMRSRIEEVVNERLEAIAKKGSMEVIEDFAYPVPVVVISEMMGVPAEDRARFQRWSRELARALDPEPFVPPDVIERRAAAIASFDELFSGLIKERRKNPKEDLVSALVAAEEEGDKLTEDEVLVTCRLLLIAGHETTVNLIGNGVLQLLRHPDELRKLREDPSLARSAVEEVLRYDPPVQWTGRVAMEDVQVGDVLVKKGDQVMLLIGAANRDPEQWPDPARFDITRDDDRHLAFGFGIHFCVGAPLARVEGQVALAAFAQRFEEPKLLTDTPEYKENIVLRGLKSLPVGFSAVSV